ncbi:ribosome recycling factor [bacterium]|nr:ribosome recycling factor [bacterium]
MFDQKQFFVELKQHFEKSIEAYHHELSLYRTGGASPVLLDGVMVDYYGTKTPLNQMASITTPDARLLVIQPFDRSIIKDIETAIIAANLGFNPNNDGLTIKMPVPALTEDRRKDIVKQLHQLTEKFKISLRTVRRDAIDEVKNAQKEKDITEDEEKKYFDDIQKRLNEFIKQLEAISTKKSDEIMQV